MDVQNLYLEVPFNGWLQLLDFDTTIQLTSVYFEIKKNEDKLSKL